MLVTFPLGCHGTIQTDSGCAISVVPKAVLVIGYRETFPAHPVVAIPLGTSITFTGQGRRTGEYCVVSTNGTAQCSHEMAQHIGTHLSLFLKTDVQTRPNRKTNKNLSKHSNDMHSKWDTSDKK